MNFIDQAYDCCQCGALKYRSARRCEGCQDTLNRAIAEEAKTAIDMDIKISRDEFECMIDVLDDLHETHQSDWDEGMIAHADDREGCHLCCAIDTMQGMIDRINRLQKEEPKAKITQKPNWKLFGLLGGWHKVSSTKAFRFYIRVNQFGEKCFFADYRIEDLVSRYHLLGPFSAGNEAMDQKANRTVLEITRQSLEDLEDQP